MKTERFTESFAAVKDGLRVRLTDLNGGMEDRDVVFIPVGCGYAYEVYLEDGETGRIAGTVRIPAGTEDRERLAELVTAAALENTLLQTPPQIRRLRDVLYPCPEEGLPDDSQRGADGVPELYVLSGKAERFGAAALFYPGAADLASKAAGGDYYVLPSSVHEVLILPDDGRQDAKVLAAMVKEINGQIVAPRERLGSRVLHYSAERKVLEVGADADEDKPAAAVPDFVL